MAVEKRGNSEFYYKKEKVNGKVKSRYMGPMSNPVIAQIAEFEAIEIKDKNTELAYQKAEIARMNELDNNLAVLIQFNRMLVKASLIAAGYYQHNREWRKARD